VLVAARDAEHVELQRGYSPTNKGGPMLHALAGAALRSPWPYSPRWDVMLLRPARQ